MIQMAGIDVSQKGNIFGAQPKVAQTNVEKHRSIISRFVSLFRFEI